MFRQKRATGTFLRGLLSNYPRGNLFYLQKVPRNLLSQVDTLLKNALLIKGISPVATGDEGFAPQPHKPFEKGLT